MADYPAGSTIHRKFTTRTTNGTPGTLVGGAVSIYKDGDPVQSTAGVTLTVDFDGHAGLNHVTVDTAADPAFYTNGSRFALVITGGAVGGNSLVGEAAGSFDLAQSLADQVWDEVLTGQTHNVNNSAGKILRSLQTASIHVGNLPDQTGMAANQVRLDAGASTTTDAYQYLSIAVTLATGGEEVRIITAYDGLTQVATVYTPWKIPPEAGAAYEVRETPRAFVGNPVSIIADGITAAQLAPDATAEIADTLLARNIGGGSSGGRTVAQALALLRNRWVRSGTTFTVYATDDTTVAWTAAVTTAAANPITGIDPP